MRVEGVSVSSGCLDLDENAGGLPDSTLSGGGVECGRRHFEQHALIVGHILRDCELSDREVGAERKCGTTERGTHQLLAVGGVPKVRRVHYVRVEQRLRLPEFS